MYMKEMDKAILIRPLLGTNWDLVFTRTGRYFFFDNAEKVASWSPPDSLLETLKRLPEAQLLAIFDPNCDEDDLADMILTEEPQGEASDQDFDEEQEETVYEIPENDSEDNMDAQQSMTEEEKIPRQRIDPEAAKAEHEAHIVAFMNLLREKEIDSFRPWSAIAEELKDEAAFQAIANPKERESLFAALSPELAERVRTARQKNHIEAEEAWANLLGSFKDINKLPPTWTEYSRQLRRTANWFKFMDQKEMEKQYRAKLKELRELAITYNVRSNKQ